MFWRQWQNLAVVVLMDINQFLRHFKNVKPTGKNSWQVSSPCRDDRNPSVSITVDNEGNILMHDFGGDSNEEIMDKLGLKMTVLFNDKNKKPKQQQQQYETFRVVDVYPYYDEKMELQYSIKKEVGNITGKKSFKTYAHIEGREVTGLNGKKKILFKLAGLIYAIKQGKTVLVAEGEKDINSLAEIGLTATTNPFGAGKWESSFNQYFHGAKDVVLIPDNDLAGFKHSKMVYENLEPLVEKIKIVLLPNTQTKEDVSDYLQSHTKADLLELCDTFKDRNIELLNRAIEELPKAEPTQAVYEPLLSSATLTNGISAESIINALNNGERGDAELLAQIYNLELRFNINNKFWYNYENGVYQRDELHDTRLKVINKLKLIYSEFWNLRNELLLDGAQNKQATKHIKNIVTSLDGRLKALNTKSKSDNVIELLGRDYLKCSTQQFDNDNNIINLQNGLFDLINFKLLPHTPEIRNTKQTGFSFMAGTEPTKFVEFLRQIFIDEESIIFFQQLLGIWLTGNTDFQYLVFAYGTGANGKSTLFNILQRFFNGFDGKRPDETASDGYFIKFDIQTILQQSGAQNQTNQNIARLQGARLAVASELPFKASLNESLIKDITGGDPITARVLYGEPFSFFPSHKTVMFGNHKPQVKDMSEGFWRRVLLLPFNNTIPESERRPMSEIMTELSNEFSGVFNWALKGLESYRKNGLLIPKAVTLATSEYQNDNSEILRFLEGIQTEYFVNKGNQNFKIPLSELLELFFNWRREAGEELEAMTARKFGINLRNLGYSTKKGNYNKSYVYGITAKPKSEGGEATVNNDYRDDDGAPF